jgi:hypothetical protein
VSHPPPVLDNRPTPPPRYQRRSGRRSRAPVERRSLAPSTSNCQSPSRTPGQSSAGPPGRPGSRQPALPDAGAVVSRRSPVASQLTVAPPSTGQPLSPPCVPICWLSALPSTGRMLVAPLQLPATVGVLLGRQPIASHSVRYWPAVGSRGTDQLSVGAPGCQSPRPGLAQLAAGRPRVPLILGRHSRVPSSSRRISAAAQRMYFRRGYLPDGRGLMYDWKPVPAGELVRLDDHATLMFTKSLR